MAFDLASARPVQQTGFDIATAKPAEELRAQRAVAEKAQADTEAANARIAAGHNARPMDLREGVRSFGAAATNLAKGVLDIPRLAETAITAPAGLVAGRPVRGPIQTVQEGLLSPAELAPRDQNEEYVAKLNQFAGGAAGGIGLAKNLADNAVGPVTRKVGETLADMPGRQLLGSQTAATAVQDVQNKGGGPIAQTLAGVVAGGAPMVGAAGTAGNLSRAAGEAPFAPGAPKFGPAVEKARRLGYPLLPSQVRGRAQAHAPAGQFSTGYATPGYFGEAFGGPDMGPMAIIDSQKRTNAHAAKELGISEITPQGLALAKNPHNAVFNEVARSVPNITPDEALTTALNALGEARRTNPLLRNSRDVELLRERLLAAGPVPTQKVLDAIREYRRDASTLYKRIGDPEAEQQAAAYRQAADALEDAIERQAGVLDPSLVPRLKDARIALAKIHNVEDSLDGNNVDALRLARIGDKFPLSGYLADIAEIAREFPATMKSATGVSLPIPSEVGVINSISLAARRHFGHSQGPRVLQEGFQEKFGAVDPTYDPRLPPTPVEGSPFAEYAPPAADAPGGADVMPPAPGGGPGLTATNLADDFDQLPPAESFPGDLTAETPPMGGSDIPQGTTGSRDEFAAYPPRVPPAGDDLAADFAQDADFIAGRSGVQDPGLDFAPDPDMASASIVRGGGEPGTVQDTLDLVEDLLGVDLRGRPLDPETGAGMSGPDVRQPYTRPAPDLGDDLGTGFGEPPADPLLGFDPVREGDFEPGVGPFQRGPRGGDDIVDADVTDTTVRRGQRKLPPPGDDDLGAAMVEPAGPNPPNIPPAPEWLLRAINEAEPPPENVTNIADPRRAASAESGIDQLDDLADRVQPPAKGDDVRNLVDDETDLGDGMVDLTDQVMDTIANTGPAANSPRTGGSLSDVLLRMRELGGVDEADFQAQLAARKADPNDPLNSIGGDMERAAQKSDMQFRTGMAGAKQEFSDLGDDLTLEDAPARPAAADLADDGLKLEDLPKRRPGDVAIKVTRNPPADIIPRKPLPPNPIVYHSGPARNPSRWLVLEDKGDSWQIRSIDTTGFKAENKGYHRGPGRELYLMAAKDAQKAKRVLNSDTDMTVDAIDAIERAVKDGELMVDDWDNAIAAARKQIEESGGKRASRGEKGGEPWFKNIRPGPAS